MKHFFSIFVGVILVSFGVKAQQWQCVYPENTVYYQSQSGIIRSVKTDSVNTIGNLSRNRLLNSLQRLDPTGECFLPDTASWLGNWITTYPDGVQEFQTFKHDTLTIRTLAVKEESWVFYHSKDSGYSILATVSDFTVQTIAGEPDSVKYISLQMIDSLGNALNSQLNVYHIELSKNHGFTAVFSLGRFPDLVSFNEPQFSLAGSENPPYGIQNLNSKDIYNFQIGDEFHSRQFKYHYEWHETSDYSNQLTITKVLNKHDYPGTDSVSYELWIASQIFGPFGNPPEPLIDTSRIEVTYHANGINQSYIPLLGITNLNVFLNLLPEENTWISESLTAADDLFENQLYNNRIQKRIQIYDWNGVCCHNYDPWFHWNTLTEFSFISGCGGPYYNYLYDNGLYGIQNVAQHNLDTLLYFKKGAEEWGVPIDTTGWHLPNGLKDQLELQNITVFPVPATDHITLDLGLMHEFPYQLQITDVSGVIIYETSINQKTTLVNLYNWNKGFYFLDIYKDKQLLGRKKLIIG